MDGLSPAFILRSNPYRDTSFLLEALYVFQGLVSY